MYLFIKQRHVEFLHYFIYVTIMVIKYQLLLALDGCRFTKYNCVKILFIYEFSRNVNYNKFLL